MSISEPDRKFISDNIKKVKQDILTYSPYPSSVRLLAATKTVDAEKINFALECGVDLIAENRVNELREKFDSIQVEKSRIHFIGQLQKNKVKYIIDKVSMIHSVDNVSLAEEIDKQAKKHDLVMNILVEVNIGDEENKGGVKPELVLDYIKYISKLSNIKICGLMSIPPICGDDEKKYYFFSEINKIFIDISHKNVDNTNMEILSMGMSSDYREALKCGANIIRLGSTIFGQRIYPVKIESNN
ncbi:MAG: YggS family pyridoxal phosphate enzyme [Clostridiales bacterium GWF2_38_85]|nr:MAG: YggS family pyridoxal phosphate enzyme [Clostridiales bacterium GWF2_38_85]HBL84205.1 YggS family pyridoxal phosphate-dependent enzyme [Clostridiales bacterium]